MASRTKQKEEARARRLAEEQARSERAQRQRRVQMLGGAVVLAVAVVAVLIAISVGGSSSKGGIPTTGKAQSKLTTQISSLLAGIPESGATLGSPTAKVTVTEFGDLECPICQSFAVGAENQLIQSDVHSGKVKLVYRSLDTATGNGPNANWFGPQQAAALAAGLQGKAWYYIELFYREQGTEGTSYVNQGYLDKLAQQVPLPFNYTKWLADSHSSGLIAQVTADENFAAAHGFNSTPTITVSGPKGSTRPLVGDQDYPTLETAINSVL